MNGNIPTDNTTLRPWDAVTERDAYIGDQRQEIKRLHKLLDVAITERDEAREAAAMWEKVALREAGINGKKLCKEESND